MHAHLKGEKAPDAKVPHAELRDFVTQVGAGPRRERVYHSDLKKLCTWYNALCRACPCCPSRMRGRRAEGGARST